MQSSHRDALGRNAGQSLSDEAGLGFATREGARGRPSGWPLSHLDGDLAIIAWRVRHLLPAQVASPSRTRARLRTIDRIVDQWTDQEIAAMPAPEAAGIARLRNLRHTVLEELGTTPTPPPGDHQ
jgi:hypothetical protein